MYPWFNIKFTKNSCKFVHFTNVESFFLALEWSSLQNRCHDSQHSDTYHNNKNHNKIINLTLHHHVAGHHAECRVFIILHLIMLSVTKLYVIMLSVTKLYVIMLSVAKLYVIILSVSMLNVMTLSVVGSFWCSTTLSLWWAVLRRFTKQFKQWNYKYYSIF
jgi:hypothetical protein